jgi:uncharacterized phage-associated protein
MGLRAIGIVAMLSPIEFCVRFARIVLSTGACTKAEGRGSLCRGERCSRRRVAAMAGARLDSVAKFICELSGWTLSNLPLQKIIYISQMEFMGEHGGDRLVDTRFEAWDNGPVSPDLYHKVKAFGSSPVLDVFSDARRFLPTDPRAIVLNRVYSNLRGKRPGALIELTHWENGAWAKNYVPGIKGIIIPDSDIFGEFVKRSRI